MAKELTMTLMRSGTNGNYDSFPEDEVRKSADSAIGKPVTINYDEKNVVGIIKKAWFNEQSKSIDAVIEVNDSVDITDLCLGFSITTNIVSCNGKEYKDNPIPSATKECPHVCKEIQHTYASLVKTNSIA